MKVDFSLVILGIFILLMIYFAVFLEIDIEYILNSQKRSYQLYGR